ncbi:hypothetical protein RB599_009565 [Gaeumannomyces hyphopodioides]
MSKEGADTRGDAEVIAVPKTRNLSFRTALSRPNSKGESSSRPSPSKPSVDDDNTLTDTLVRYIRDDKPGEARTQARKKGIQLQKTYDPQKHTVLHMAAAAESMAEVLRMLLGRPDAARHVNQADSAGRTALHEAAVRAMPSAMLDELINAGASTDIVDRQLLTPLHAFIIENCRPGADDRVFKSLVEDGGAEVNTKNSLNDTPLHGAARRNNESLIRLLLRHGADPDSVNADGKTPQDLLPEDSAANRIFLEPRAKWNPRNPTKIPTKPPVCEDDRRAVCESFYVTVWFYYRPESLSWSQTSTVYSVIYEDTIPKFEKQLKDIIKNSSSSAAERKAKTKGDKTYLHPNTHNQNSDTSRDDDFGDDIWKWIHLPANNMTWVKHLIYRLTFSDRGSARLRHALKFVDRHTKEHKDNRGYFRLPHVEEERRDDDIGVGDNNDDNDMAGSPLVSPSITYSAPPTNGSGMNQHSSNPGYFPPVENSPPPPPKTSKPPRAPGVHETHKKSHARSKLPNEAWRSQKVSPKSRRRLSLVIPYFDFETDLYLSKVSTSRTPPTPGDPGGAGSGERQFDRMTALEQHYPPFGGLWGLQLPQTLDESYYQMLTDDELHARNRDQIIYKWSSEVAVDESGISKTQPQDAEDEGKRDLHGMAPAEASDDSPPRNGASHQAEHGTAPPSKDDGTAADAKQGSTANRDHPFGKDRKEKAMLVRDRDGLSKSQNSTRTHRRKLLVVHQLWLWKLDENTVITSHPERWHTGIEDTLLETIRQSGIGEFQEPDDLIEHIVSECARFIEEYRYAGLGEHILEIFENSIATRSNQEVECFKRLIAQLENDPRNKPDSLATAVGGRSKVVMSSSNEKETIFEETKLIREIKDIRDELQMLGRVFKDQAKIVERFAQLFWPDTEKDKKIRQQFTDYCGVQNLKARTTRLDNNAHQSLQDLYYLVQVKQAQSSLHEAITATVMSKRAQTLNDYILVFTTITVIFTPLAFMTSLFALPINSFPQNETGSASYAADWFAIRIMLFCI